MSCGQCTSVSGLPVSYDAELYKERGSVERCISKIKDRRELATRFDKEPESYMAGTSLAAVPSSGCAASVPSHDHDSEQTWILGLAGGRQAVCGPCVGQITSLASGVLHMWR